MTRIPILLFILSGFLMSCKKNLYAPRNTKFAVEDINFEYLSSKAKLKYSNGKQKISIQTTLRIQKDSVIWVSISPGLGLELARIRITRKSIQAIDKLKREYYETSFEELSELYGFDINFDLIESIALGNTLFMPRKKKNILEEKNQYIYKRMEGKFGIHHFIGKNSKKMEKLYAYDAVTFNSVLVNYDKFQRIEGYIMPQSIQATVSFADQRNREPVSVEVEYNRISLLKEPLSFPFNVSEKYTKKKLY